MVWDDRWGLLRHFEVLSDTLDAVEIQFDLCQDPAEGMVSLRGTGSTPQQGTHLTSCRDASAKISDCTMTSAARPSPMPLHSANTVVINTTTLPKPVREAPP